MFSKKSFSRKANTVILATLASLVGSSSALAAAPTLTAQPSSETSATSASFSFNATNVGNGTINTIAGQNNVYGSTGDGGPATSANIGNVIAVDTAPDGTIYLADNNNNRVRKISPSGVISNFAGNGTYGSGGDGGLATNASMSNPSALAVGPDGSVFIATSNVIRKVSPAGIITTVAGNSSYYGFSGDGGPATNASFGQIYGIAVSSSGDVYVADYGNQRIRKFTPGGNITTIAGNGSYSYAGDGVPATSTSLSTPLDVAVGADNSVYIADYGASRIRRVDPATNIITTVAGNGIQGYNGDGLATTHSLYYPRSVDVLNNGDLYIGDSNNNRVRKVSSGNMTTVAGNGTDSYTEGALATNTGIGFGWGIDATEDGSLILPSWSHNTIRKVSGNTPTECSLDGAAYTVCASPINYTALVEGTHNFKVRQGTEVASYDWLIDLTDPVATITEPSTRQHYLLDQNVTSDFSCSDPLAGSPAAASGIASCVSNSFSTGVLGPHVFEVTATDDVGHTSTSKKAYVIDPPAYKSIISSDDPIAYYQLDDALGADKAADSSTNNHEGTYKNSVVTKRSPAISCQVAGHRPQACALANEPRGNSAFFGPRDGYVSVDNLTAPTQSYTLEAWVKPTNSNDMMIAAHGGSGQLFIKDGKLQLRQVQDTLVGSAIAPGQWHHVAGVWDGSTTKLYLDGQLVASSGAMNKAPSGTSTFYVGYGDQAPWMHGNIDEVAYYSQALSASKIAKRWNVGTAFDHPSIASGTLATAAPEADIVTPAQNGTYAPAKVPHADFSCDDIDGSSTVVSCVATVDGNAISSGDALPSTSGAHVLTLVATDEDGLTYSHTHNYTVSGFESIILGDSPLAYYRLDDAADSTVMNDRTGQNHGTYKNDQTGGSEGISGDGNMTREFLGRGGYGYVNNLAAPQNSYTLESWINPDDTGDMMIIQGAGALYIKGGHFVFRHDQTEITGGNVTADTWVHVAGVWDGQKATLFVNGYAVDSVETTKRPRGAATFYVGYGEFAPWTRGQLDEASYYPSALSDARVYQHYLADPPPATNTYLLPIAPITEAPKTEAPTENPVIEAPKTEAPVAEAPKTEAPVAESPKTETPKAKPPVSSTPKSTKKVKKTKKVCTTKKVTSKKTGKKVTKKTCKVVVKKKK